jgi:uncharacterized repeat protein (TIGR01451 family)
LDSRQLTVTDHVPDGLAVADAGGGTIAGGATITWTIADLAAGDTTTRTFTAMIADITKRPFRNIAEISSDSANSYSSPTETIHDIDSIPDADVANDGDYGSVMAAGAIDNHLVLEAGAGADDPINGGEDDADIADVDVPVTYDLALIKTGPASIANDGTALFSITIQNQGNVPSGAYSVTDVVPAGMTAVATSSGGSPASPALRRVRRRR